MVRLLQPDQHCVCDRHLLVFFICASTLFEKMKQFQINFSHNYANEIRAQLHSSGNVLLLADFELLELLFHLIKNV